MLTLLEIVFLDFEASVYEVRAVLVEGESVIAVLNLVTENCVWETHVVLSLVHLEEC